jgi:hypothetical protein
MTGYLSAYSSPTAQGCWMFAMPENEKDRLRRSFQVLEPYGLVLDHQLGDLHPVGAC